MTMRLVPRQPKAKICLAMIVRDEAHVIERCLNSCVGVVDFVRIIDTGSRDNTLDRIRMWALANPKINVKTSTSEWKNFRDNRNELLDYAKHCSASHLLLLDADEILHINQAQIPTLKEQLAKLPSVGFVIPMVYGKGMSARINLVRNERQRIQYHHMMHEELWLDDDPYPVSTLMGHPADYYQGPHVTTPQDGARSKDPDKVSRDMALLKVAFETEKHPRYIFYMGQTLRAATHLTNDQDAWRLIRETYERYLFRTKDEVNTYRYVAALWVARVSELLGEEPKQVVAAYLRCYNIDKLRPEAMGSCAAYCMDKELFQLAEEAARCVASCTGSANFAFTETQWQAVATDILLKLKEVVA